MTEIEVYQPANGQLAVAVAHSFDDWIPVLREVIGLAEAIADSPFVPDGLRGSVPAVAAAILTARELGVPPMTGLANIHLIKGKTGLSALLMRALIQSKGHEWVDVEVTDTRVVLRGRRRGEAEWAEASFNRDQAKTAGIQLHPYPQDKLYARASVRLARRKFADVIAGMPYSAEELEDGELDQVTDTTDQPADPPKPAQRIAQRRRTAPAAGDDTRSQPRVEPPAGAQQGSTGESSARNAVPRAAGAAPSRGAQPPPPQDTGLPPLPGEDEEPPGPPGRATGATTSDASSTPETSRTGNADRHQHLVGIVRAHFKRLGFEDDEREQRLATTAVIAGVPADLATTTDLTEEQLSVVADTLARCRDRERLIVLLTKGDKADG